MKFILCTGDSHTCGQYADGSGSWMTESLGYNILGKGFGPVNFWGRDYVNLIKNYVTDHTNSRVENMDITSWGNEFARFRKIERPITIPGGCDALLLRVAEKTAEATLGIYLDGELYRTKKLHAEVTRYGLWSIGFVMIPCTGVKEITLKAESGYVYINSCERWSGEYAVVNCGVGSCTVGRYKNECLPDLLEEFPERIFLAEVHTINDWVKNNTIEAYSRALSEMLEIMKKNAELTMAITVSPILREEPVPYATDFYEKFVDAAYEVIEKAGVPMIDAHKAFAEKIAGKSAEELIGTVYGDDLHPRQPGYTLYAEKIIEKLKGVL
ncbi:MAG: SGNH/GDSL hydrolase family protein [Clostridia bacterium]|nr:SGNH/GDSL hydrolase family protein [Clostridia bacterium]